MEGYYRVGVTGSRQYAGLRTIQHALGEINKQWAGSHLIVLVNGQANPWNPATGTYIRWENALDLSREHQYELIGGDWLTFLTGRELGWLRAFYQAKWRRDGRRAGYIRNGAMIEDGARQWEAFLSPCANLDCPYPPRDIPHPTHGTEDCARRAHQARIPTTWWPELPALDHWFGRHPEYTRGEVPAA